MPSHSGPSMSNAERGDARLTAEEWQLRILWELHQKQPRPTVEQRRLLATQTGLDAKWIARWFKRVNYTPKSKLRCTVGPALSGTKTAVAATSGIDGTDFVQSANSAELISSGTSPSLSGGGGRSKGCTDATLFSHSGGIVSESVRTAAAATATGPPSPHYTQPRSWELEHYPTLQANRDLERSAFYSLAQGGAHPPPVAPPLPHADLAEHSQQRTLGTATAIPVHLMTSATFIEHSPSPTATSADARSAAATSSRGPHASSPSPGTPLQTGRFHLNLVSDSSVLACPELGRSPPRRDLGPSASISASMIAAVGGAARPQVDGVDLPLVVSDFPVPVPVPIPAPQLGMSPSPTPLPSMYWFLFDADCETVGPCGDEAFFRSQPKTLMDGGNINAGVTGPPPPPPLVDPTPISFLAKWEDMLALERRIRSSHFGNHHPDLPAQPKQAQAQAQSQAQTQTQTLAQTSLTQSHAPQMKKKKKAAEASRTKRCSRELSNSKSLTTGQGEADRSVSDCSGLSHRCANNEQRFSPTDALSGMFAEPRDDDNASSDALQTSAGAD